MKILMLNYEFPPLGGGAGNATYYLLKEFAKYKDLEIDLVTSSTSSSKIQQFSKNIKIFYLDIGKSKKPGSLHYQTNKELLTYSRKAYKFCKKLIKKNKKQNPYMLCHAFFGIPCGYIAMKLHLPYITSLRGSDVPGYNKRFYLLDKLIFRKLSRRIWKKAKDVIANSQGLKELALRTNPNQKIDIIYNGIDIDEFKPIKNKKTNKPIKLISTGRLIQRKGYKYLIEALKGLNAELTIIGEGNLEKELKELALKNKVNVNFLGKINHNKISEYLQKADVFILPSLNEGMSNSILEAMACGLPIITTDTGGSKELIKGNGFIVSKANPDALKSAIEKFLSKPGLIKSMGNKSRLLAEKMSWENVAKEYYGVYGR